MRIDSIINTNGMPTVLICQFLRKNIDENYEQNRKCSVDKKT